MIRSLTKLKIELGQLFFFTAALDDLKIFIFISRQLSQTLSQTSPAVKMTTSRRQASRAVVRAARPMTPDPMEEML